LKYTLEIIAQQRKWCDLTSGLDVGDFAGLLEEALDEVEALYTQVEKLKHEVDHAEQNVIDYALESAGIPAVRKQELEFFVAYSDEGPTGCCGQDVASTGHDNKLYRLKTYEDMKHLIELIEKNVMRRRKPRILGAWTTYPEEYGMPEVRPMAFDQEKKQ